MNVVIGATTANSSLEVVGSVAAAINVISASTTLTASNYTTILSGGVGQILTFPAANTCTRRIYVIVNRSGNSWTTSAYLPFSGAAVTTLATGNAITIQSDGTNWYRIE